MNVFDELPIDGSLRHAGNGLRARSYLLTGDGKEVVCNMYWL